MAVHNCFTCGKALTKRQIWSHAKYCSIECRNNGEWRQNAGRPREREPIAYICQNCGETFYDRRHGVTTGRKFCSHRCRNMARPSFARGINENPGQPGDRKFVDGRSGYVITTGERGYRNLEHREIMERQLGRPLKAHETVHHKDGNRQNNALDNLELWSKRHPPGQRVSDKIAFCVDFLKEYGIKVVVPSGGIDIGVPPDYNLH